MLDAGFCVVVLSAAIHKFEPSNIMNMRQSYQIKSFVCNVLLRRPSIRISMDGKGRFLNDILVERLR